MHDALAAQEMTSGMLFIVALCFILSAYIALIFEGIKIHWGWGIANFILILPFGLIFGIMYWSEKKVKFWFLVLVFGLLGVVFFGYNVVIARVNSLLQ